jgi:16S rRNA (guanine527-N7)-methyltransferase
VTEGDVLERWLEALVSTPGLTATRDPATARRVHVDDALSALPYVTCGPVVDVGSGGGSPGVPIAVHRPWLEVHLLEASERKTGFLERWTAELPNVRVVRERAERWGRGEGRDRYAIALARALAVPRVAAEWCLPLVRPGGSLVLFAGGDLAGLAEAAAALGASPDLEVVPVADSEQRRLVIVRKVGPTPDRYPRRAAAARRPL